MSSSVSTYKEKDKPEGEQNNRPPHLEVSYLGRHTTVDNYEYKWDKNGQNDDRPEPWSLLGRPENSVDDALLEKICYLKVNYRFID